MKFTEYLKSKKIDPKPFVLNERELFDELKKVFDQVHPDSFTAQKLFLINPLRRKYKLKEEQAEVVKKKPMARPKISKPKI